MLPKSTPSLLPLLILVVAGCTQEPETGTGQAIGGGRAAVFVGTLQSALISEASGLAYSRREPDRLWVVNDGVDGKDPYGQGTRLHAITSDGTDLGFILVQDVENRDWEDLASFRYQGVPYLLIGDIGDNGGIRDHLTLYVVPEPEGVELGVVSPAWTLRFTYPDGPHDTEAVAVDAAAERILVLTKRTIPPQLHELPLRPAADAGVLQTRRVLDIATLPQRGDAALQGLAAAIPYHWQPVGMDIAADGSAMVILTYADVYYYARAPGESWGDALSRAPRAAGMPLVPLAEGVAFDDRGDSIFVTAEGRNAPLLRFDHP